MKPVLYGLVGVALAAGAACAQTTTAPTTTPRPGMTTTAPQVPAQRAPYSKAPNAFSSTDNTGKAAASGDFNQAVSTTSQSADTPARGANSFTESQARSRMEAKGYTNISGLSKNADGVWEGKAEKNGRQTSVWLDYKGNVGDRS